MRGPGTRRDSREPCSQVSWRGTVRQLCIHPSAVRRAVPRAALFSSGVGLAPSVAGLEYPRPRRAASAAFVLGGTWWHRMRRNALFWRVACRKTSRNYVRSLKATLSSSRRSFSRGGGRKSLCKQAFDDLLASHLYGYPYAWWLKGAQTRVHAAAW